ncbi:MAG: iron-containing alcohol dehydrogenase [Gammaproteobacteria bacterium]|nr:iron-containing alcohol dehydrogenase [Gammaproteobacteria bacterium]
MKPALDEVRMNWNYPTAVRFGVGRIAELADACRAAGIERPLLVTDRGLAELPMIREALSRLDAGGLGAALFADVRGNPVEANVSAGLEAYRGGRHDGIVAFGGGSALDVGKAVALMAGQTRPMWDFEDREDWYTRADPRGIAPIVAVPTTSGTGSEVGRASVITDERDHVKKIIFHPKMMPSVVIEDPALTVGLPAHLTAAVGMDALSHNLEAYCSPLFHPMADGIALEGMRLIKEWLPRACADGGDLRARAAMQVAASMGATAFQKGLGAMHSLSHPCGSRLDTHHGLTNGVVMPYVLEFNADAVADKLDALARYLDLPGGDARAVREWVLELRRAIGIPHTLAELGVEESMIGELAPMAVSDPTAPTNPVPLTLEAAETLYARAIRGEVAA